jgi:hypothetical protein
MPAKKKTPVAVAAPARKPRNTNSKAAKLDLAQAGSAVSYANSLTVEQLVNQMGALQTTVQGSLAGLSAQLTSKLSESQQLDLAIAEKARRFQELTAKEAEAVTLDELKLEIEATRKTWAEETAEANRQHGIAMAQLREEQSRYEEQRDFDYKTAHDQWKTEQQHRETEAARLAQIRQEDLERGWKLREEQLKAQEQEIIDMRTAVAGHEAAIKAAVDAAVATATSALNRSHEHEITFAKQQAASEVTLATQQLKAAQAALTQAEARNTALEARANAAEQRTLDVVQSALNVQAANDRAQAVQQTAQSASAAGKR